jgi:hypothetical protein
MDLRFENSCVDVMKIPSREQNAAIIGTTCNCTECTNIVDAYSGTCVQGQLHGHK